MSPSEERANQALRTSPAKRFTTAEKVSAVLRLLKGESTDVLSRELGVAVNRLERWQNDFVTGGSAAVGNWKSSGSGDWVSKHAAAIFQWFAFLIVLALVIGLLELFLQRGRGE